MKIMLGISCFILSTFAMAQTDAEITSEIADYQASENEKFANPETTILEKKDFKRFDGLQFYPINLSYRVVARFVRTPEEVPFLMPTTTNRRPEYVKYGELYFEIDGKQLQLSVYQNTTGYDDPALKDHLFLPFTDLTSGDGSYGGGRFIDTSIPAGDTLILDFNKAYNPYCAYNKRYSCPIPPAENDLQVRIEAGVKDFGDH